MEQIKAIIVDDELAARHLLQQMLQEQFAEVQVLAQCKDLPEGIKAIRKYEPDVVFLDIEMPNHSGLEILDYFNEDEINFEIVFVTAYSEYAVKAFQLAAIDYILKPIDDEQLERAITRLKNTKKLKVTAEQMQTFKANLNTNTPTKICIPTSEGKYFFEPKDLIYFRADGAYTEVFAEKQKLYVGKNIKYFEELLQNHPDFMRIHRSFLVNLRKVSKYINANAVSLSNGAEVQVSPEKVQAFHDRIKL
jgi:two-component system LytT family response regulator